MLVNQRYNGWSIFQTIAMYSVIENEIPDYGGSNNLDEIPAPRMSFFIVIFLKADTMFIKG